MCPGGCKKILRVSPYYPISRGWEGEEVDDPALSHPASKRALSSCRFCFHLVMGLSIHDNTQSRILCSWVIEWSWVSRNYVFIWRFQIKKPASSVLTNLINPCLGFFRGHFKKSSLASSSFVH